MMANNLYLYSPPFLVPDNEANRVTHLLSYLTEEERTEQQKIFSLVLKFAITEKFIVSGDSGVTQNRDDNLGSWKWFISWMNFRSLIDLNEYGSLMSALQTNNSYAINQTLDLHTRLGSLFEHKLLNTLANRTISSVSAIPYDVPVNSPVTNWNRIHGETPFIWLLILTQIIIRSQL